MTTPVVVSVPELRAMVTGSDTTWFAVATRSGPMRKPVPMSDCPQEVASMRITPELSVANSSAKEPLIDGVGEAVAEFVGGGVDGAATGIAESFP